eukprot:6291362-Amphidinium_carterae.1
MPSQIWGCLNSGSKHTQTALAPGSLRFNHKRFKNPIEGIFKMVGISVLEEFFNHFTVDSVELSKSLKCFYSSGASKT